MSDKDKNPFFPAADFNADGKVDDFELGLFHHMMEEEDKTIAEGKGFFGSGSSRVSFSVTFGSDDDDDEDEDEFDDDEEIELDRIDSLDEMLQEYKRRIDAMIEDLQQILDAAEEFVDDGYDKYGDTDRYEQAENIVNNLGDAITDLENASSSIDMASD